MKKILVLSAIFLIFGAASQASALSFGDAYFVGTITPGGGNPDKEVAQVNLLTNPSIVPLGATVPDADADLNDYYRSLNYFGVMPYVDPDTVDDGNKQDNGNTTFDATGYEYVVGKYAHDNAGVAVWYKADGFGIVTLPGTWWVMINKEWTDTGQYGLSHTDVHNSVPEPSTMLLLGFGLVGLVGCTRKVKK